MFKQENWVSQQTGNPKIFKIAAHIIIGFISLILIFGSFGTVSAGERGVKTRLGAVVSVIDPGLYFKLPIMEKVNIMDIQTQTVQYDNQQKEGDLYEGSSLFAASRDLQDVQIATVVNYHIDPTSVDTIFQQYKSTETYQNNVIEPIIRDTIKAISSQYTAEELVTKRADFNDKATASLIDQMNGKYLIIERVNITNFEFSKAFNEAIEQKVTAQQNAEAAKNKLEQVKFEAQQTIETARADAEAIRIKAQAITTQGGADYVRLQAIAKWNGNVPQTMIPGASVPFINLNN